MELDKMPSLGILPSRIGVLDNFECLYTCDRTRSLAFCSVLHLKTRVSGAFKAEQVSILTQDPLHMV